MSLQEGLVATQETTVGERNTAKYLGSGNMEVYATPALIAFMENTALVCVQDHLDAGTDTVGIQIDAKHTKATKLGEKLSCTAKLLHIDNKKLSFEITAESGGIPIGSAFHVRYIVDPVKFMSKL